MIITVFRSRLRPEHAADYMKMVAKMKELAAAMPGYIAHKGFTAEDGERVTIVEFADEETQRGWAAQIEHRAAQQRGREAFYQEYRLQICSVLKDRSYPKR